MPSEGITWISDGTNIFELDNAQLTYVKLIQPDTEELVKAIPDQLDTTTNEIYRYPLATWALSPVADYIYPTGLAQRAGDYTISGEDDLLNRRVWILDYQLNNDLGDLTMSAKYWVDQKTGIILKAEVYSTEPDTPGKLIELSEVQWIEFNSTISDEAFAPDLNGYTAVEPN